MKKKVRFNNVAQVKYFNKNDIIYNKKYISNRFIILLLVGMFLFGASWIR
jgi:hypothetical protein